MALIDTHCHLTYAQLGEGDGGLDATLTRARDAGVTGMVTICCHPSKEWDKTRQIIDTYDHIWATYGVHPHEAADPSEETTTVADLVSAVQSHPKIIGIGECGLDYFYDHSPRDQQRAMFETHVAACLETDMPIIIHTREAEDDTIAILRAAGGKLRGLIHCFSGTQKLADAALDLGMSLSFSGIVTFKKADDLRAVAKTVPVNRMLVETDAPYLAPLPYRGKPNEPAYVTETARILAQVKDMPFEAFCTQTTENFYTLFPRVNRT